MEKLTKQKALEVIEEIKSLKHCYELAHELEDELYSEFTVCLAEEVYESIEEIIEIAKVISSSKKIDFARHTA